MTLVPLMTDLNCSGTGISLNSSPLGTITFTSLHLALTISVLRDCLLRNIWHPSVLSTMMMGTLPRHWTWTLWQLVTSTPETRLGEAFKKEKKISLQNPKKCKKKSRKYCQKNEKLKTILFFFLTACRKL